MLEASPARKRPLGDDDALSHLHDDLNMDLVEDTFAKKQGEVQGALFYLRVRGPLFALAVNFQSSHANAILPQRGKKHVHSY